MSRFYATPIEKEEDRELAIAKCASECLKRDCLMYRSDNSTGKCLFIYDDPKMCNGDIITNELPGEKIAIFEKRTEGAKEKMCSYKGLSSWESKFIFQNTYFSAIMLVGGAASDSTAEIIKVDGTRVCQVADTPDGSGVAHGSQEGLVRCRSSHCYTYRTVCTI